jgi:predicted GTPase
MSDNIIRFALVGKTGNGKSSTGNSILRSKSFLTGTSSDGVTDVIQSSSGCFESHRFSLLDTPGVFDPNKSDTEIINELKKIVDFLHPGPHAFVIVLKANRFTKEDNLGVEIFSKLFGEAIFNHSIVLFTGLDSIESEGQNLFEMVQTTKNEDLRKILEKCNYRYLGFNNRLEFDSDQNRNQVRNLFEMINRMTNSNMYNYYSSGVFKYSTQNVEERREAVQNSPLLSSEEKKSRLKEIEDDVVGFFSGLTAILTSIKALFTAVSALCNIL